MSTPRVQHTRIAFRYNIEMLDTQWYTAIDLYEKDLSKRYTHAAYDPIKTDSDPCVIRIRDLFTISHEKKYPRFGESGN